MQVPAPDHLSLALTLRDRVVLGYHVSAIEGRFSPPRDPFCSSPRNCDNPVAQGGGNDLSKVTERGWGKERNTAGPADKQGCER